MLVSSTLHILKTCRPPLCCCVFPVFLLCNFANASVCSPLCVCVRSPLCCCVSSPLCVFVFPFIFLCIFPNASSWAQLSHVSHNISLGSDVLVSLRLPSSNYRQSHALLWLVGSCAQFINFPVEKGGLESTSTSHHGVGRQCSIPTDSKLGPC